jgi:hypothetical protein
MKCSIIISIEFQAEMVLLMFVFFFLNINNFYAKQFI